MVWGKCDNELYFVRRSLCFIYWGKCIKYRQTCAFCFFIYQNISKITKVINFLNLTAKLETFLKKNIWY